MLDVFTQTYASRVRADRHAELRSHQDNREVFIHAAQAATVDLAEIDGTRRQELLKKDAIGTVFSGGDADGTDGLSNRGVTENVVGIRGFLDPPGIEFRQRPHARDRFTNIPTLVGIHHELVTRADLLADYRSATDVISEITANLHFEIGPSSGKGRTA